MLPRDMPPTPSATAPGRMPVLGDSDVGNEVRVDNRHHWGAADAGRGGDGGVAHASDRDVSPASTGADPVYARDLFSPSVAPRTVVAGSQPAGWGGASPDADDAVTELSPGSDATAARRMTAGLRLPPLSSTGVRSPPSTYIVDIESPTKDAADVFDRDRHALGGVGSPTAPSVAVVPRSRSGSVVATSPDVRSRSGSAVGASDGIAPRSHGGSVGLAPDGVALHSRRSSAVTASSGDAGSRHSGGVAAPTVVTVDDSEAARRHGDSPALDGADDDDAAAPYSMDLITDFDRPQRPRAARLPVTLPALSHKEKSPKRRRRRRTGEESGGGGSGDGTS
jgi:hypothetical protein